MPTAFEIAVKALEKLTAQPLRLAPLIPADPWEGLRVSISPGVDMFRLLEGKIEPTAEMTRIDAEERARRQAKNKRRNAARFRARELRRAEKIFVVSLGQQVGMCPYCGDLIPQHTQNCIKLRRQSDASASAPAVLPAPAPSSCPTNGEGSPEPEADSELYRVHYQHPPYFDAYLRACELGVSRPAFVAYEEVFLSACPCGMRKGEAGCNRNIFVVPDCARKGGEWPKSELDIMTAVRATARGT